MNIKTGQSVLLIASTDWCKVQPIADLVLNAGPGQFDSTNETGFPIGGKVHEVCAAGIVLTIKLKDFKPVHILFPWPIIMSVIWTAGASEKELEKAIGFVAHKKKRRPKGE